MKKYIAKPLDEQLEEVSGSPTEFRKKFQDIYYIYSKPLNKANVKKYLQEPTRDADYEVFSEVGEDGLPKSTGVMFYWQTPIMTHPRTIGQFITVSVALGREVYWEEETYRKYIYVNEAE